MGAGNTTMSKSMNEIINKTINNISNEVKTSCISDNTNMQNIDIKFNKISGCSRINISNIGQRISTKSSLNCKSENMDQTTLETTLKNNLAAATKTVQDSPLLSFGSQAIAESINSATNEITSDINIKKMTESIMKSLNNQSTVIDLNEIRCFPENENGKTIGTEININDIGQDILNNTILDSITQNQSVVEAVTKIDNTMKAAAESTSLGLSSVLSAAFLPLVIGFIVYLIIVGFGFKLLSAFKSKGKSNASKSRVNEFGSAETTSTTTKSNNIPIILFSVFTMFSIVMFSLLSIQIGKVSQFSTKIALYYAMLVFYVIMSIAAIAMIMLYAKSPNSITIGLGIMFVILSAGTACTLIAMTQIEVNKLQASIDGYKDRPDYF